MWMLRPFPYVPEFSGFLMLLVSLLFLVSLLLCISAVTVRRFWLLASCDLALEGALLLLSILLI
jgi:hypothetical protein